MIFCTQIQVSRTEQQILTSRGQNAQILASVKFLDGGLAARTPTVGDVVEILDAVEYVSPNFNLYKVCPYDRLSQAYTYDGRNL